MLEFSVTVVDNRPEFANAERLPWADTIIAEEYAAAIEKVAFNDRTYVVILTHKHTHDYEVLEMCLNKKYRYLGMIGSKAKVAKVLQQLRDKGVAEDIIAQIHSPVGIKIGANTPAEIAISILAEIIQVRSTAEPMAPQRLPERKMKPARMRIRDAAEALGIDPAQAAQYSLVGGGGKTTAMFRLAHELKALGKKVLVTTTTNIAHARAGAVRCAHA